MWKNRLTFVPLLLVILLSLTAGPALAAPVKAVNPQFTSAVLSLKQGTTLDLKTKLRASAKVTYVFASSNAKTASVSSAGIVTGVAAGKAAITATVSQKGYSGKASVVIQVTAPAAAGGSTASASAKPVVYKDPALLDADIRTGLKTLFKKDYSKLTAEEAAQQAKLLNIDRQQLLAGLQAIIVKGEPSWSAAMVQDFAVHNLEGNIKEIAALFTKSEGDEWGQRAALELLKVFKSDKALQAFGNLLLTSSDANLRYSLAYLVSTFKGDPAALSFLINAVLKETDDKAWGNEAAALIAVAGTDKDTIDTVILTSGQFSAEKKEQFAGFLGYSDPSREALLQAWKTALNANLQSPVDALRDASTTLLNALKKFPLYRN
ncbi:Ig-like domain-containing protein [Paenibacillus sp. NFR01]|uniref:Ig-like domain-containing protein n=1 Tax=Paenibacillus sp. NFR01 TaxID=1566279 RepID=UPI0008B10001|nr:Ig-like domain-containing protein [Paenibacillus sp. NFR01]SEU25840.1 Ig-like domain (group 2) [Paenibacillus sp. NFR01]